MAKLLLYFSVAWRQWRGSRSGLFLLVVCMVLASASLGVVSMLGDTVRAGIENDGRRILGGDLSLSIQQRKIDDTEKNYLETNSVKVSEITTLSTMARTLDGQGEGLVSLKAVDRLYPMIGTLEVDGIPLTQTEVQEFLTGDGTQGVFGAIVHPTLLDRLGLAVGDRLIIGETQVEIRGVLGLEPDPSFRVMIFGARMVISQQALQAAGLVQPGSLVRYLYRIKIQEDQDVKLWSERFSAQFPNRGWRVRDYTRPLANAEDGLERTWMFLALSSLITVLSAGIGISNGVRRFLQTQLHSIATMRVLGARRREIQYIYTFLLGGLALLSIIAGLMLAATLLILLLPLLRGLLPIAFEATFAPWSFVYTLLNSLLLCAVSALVIVTSASSVNPGILFRQGVNSLYIQKPDRFELFVLAGCIAGLLVLNIGFTTRPDLSAIFITASLLLLFLLWLVGKGLTHVAKSLSTRVFLLRIALSNLSRPGAVTGQVIVSLGLGLSVLVLINSLEVNMTQRLKNVLENEAPSMYFIDIQPQQLALFRETVEPFQEQLNINAMLRGRITHLAGTAVEDLPKNEEYGWITKGDRAFTWSATWEGDNAASAPIVAGEWWPEDYAGEPLVSFDFDAAQSFGLGIGDTIGINLLGREFNVKITNMRKIDWENLAMNFVMVLSPGVIASAPHSNIATVTTPPGQEALLQKAVVSRLPNVSVLRIKDIYDKISALLGSLLLTIRSIGGVSILVGAIVLVSALIAVQSQKVYENQILRVIGADRRKVLQILLLELVFLGSVAAIIATVAGNLISWAIVRFGLNTEFFLDVEGALLTVLFGQGVVILFGMLIAWNDLGRINASRLRND